MGPLSFVDHGSVCDADLRCNLAAAMIVAGCFSLAERRDLPELPAGIGTEGVNAVILSDHIHGVVQTSVNELLIYEQGLSVDFAIHRKEIDFAEGVDVHIAGRQCGFLVGRSLTEDVVVIRKHIGGIRNRQTWAGRRSRGWCCGIGWCCGTGGAGSSCRTAHDSNSNEQQDGQFSLISHSSPHGERIQPNHESICLKVALGCETFVRLGWKNGGRIVPILRKAMPMWWPLHRKRTLHYPAPVLL